MKRRHHKITDGKSHPGDYKRVKLDLEYNEGQTACQKTFPLEGRIQQISKSGVSFNK